MNNDLISRRAAKLALIEKGQHSRRYKWGEIWELNGLEIREVLNNLPSVQPEQKPGRWIETDDCDVWRCSECDEYFCLYEGTPQDNKYYYCPNCGAKMEGIE